MSTPNVLEQRIAERDQAISAARAIAESDEFNPEDATFVDLQTRATELDKRIGSLSSLLDQQAAADAFDGKMTKAAQTRQQQPPQRVMSWGETFVRSAEFGDYPGRGTSPQVFVDGDVETRALPTGLSDLVAAGWKPTPYRSDQTAPPAPTPLLDNITSIQVSNNAIEIVVWAKVAGGAAVVAEKAAKPSAEYAPTVTPGTLDTIAVWTKLTRQLLEDENAVRTKIDNELRREVLRATEAAAAAALAAATATIPDAVVAGKLLDAIRVGIGTVQAQGYLPTAVLLNPADWATMDLTVMGDTLNGPRINQTFWGLTPIPSTAQPAGTAVVGDFRAGVEHYYRSSVALYASDSAFDGDFTKNLFTLLAEQRSKTAVVQPKALCEAKTA